MINFYLKYNAFTVRKANLEALSSQQIVVPAVANTATPVESSGRYRLKFISPQLQKGKGKVNNFPRTPRNNHGLGIEERIRKCYAPLSSLSQDQFRITGPNEQHGGNLSWRRGKNIGYAWRRNVAAVEVHWGQGLVLRSGKV